jgi:coenzyme F420-reducing hydrogenase beta subunit
VCPIINQEECRKPLAVYAANNKNDAIRLKSSSGGIFTLLAEKIINDGGVVFGAKFNEQWNVVHDYTEAIDGLDAFRRSKYVQSIIGDCFQQTKLFLTEGRKVLFSGTPCQIAGLKKFLRKEYANLLTVEVVCHGVPSPMIWRDYLDYKRARLAKSTSTTNESPSITDISFRDKTHGWEKSMIKICYTAESPVLESNATPNCEMTPFSKDLFMKGFLKNIYLRPSCYHCAARQGKSGADISLADYWGVQHLHPDIYDNKGTGLVLIYSERGARFYNSIANKIQYLKSSYDKAIMHNPCIVESVKEPKRRSQFWQNYPISKIDYIETICNLMTPSPIIIFIQKFAQKLKKIIRL